MGRELAVDFLAAGARSRPDAIGLDDGERTWTYREFDARVAVAAGRLRALDVTGDVVALVSQTTAPAVVAVHAALRAGAVLAPLSPRLTVDELRHALGVLAPGLVLAGSDTRRRVLEAGVHPARVYAIEHWLSRALAGRATSGPERPPLPKGSRVVIWTSGTGGRSRGVALTFANLEANIQAASARLSLGPHDRWLATLELAHIGGLMLVLRAAATSASLVVQGRFLADKAAGLIASRSIPHASLVPTMLQQLIEAAGNGPTHALGCLLVGGAGCPRGLIEKALGAGMPLALSYGMTETTSQAATAPPALVREKPGTVGAPLQGLDVRVGESGEVKIRGSTVAAGYVGAELSVLDSDGWLATGDLGEMDGDGHLWISGRVSDRIVTGGVNVDPAEVEGVLLRHDGVLDVAVVGLPDDPWGEVVAAAVVRAVGEDPSPAELGSLARACLATAKVPRRWLFLAEIPRNANGKIDRDAVRLGFPTP